jgi:hypothetical protein
LKKEDRRCTKNYNSKLLEAVSEHKQQQLRFITAGKRKQKKRGFKGTVHDFFTFSLTFRMCLLSEAKVARKVLAEKTFIK